MKWITFFVTFCVVSLALAGDRNMQKLSLTGVSQNVTNDTVNSTEKIDGYIDAIYLEISANHTATVSMVTTTNVYPAETIFSKTSFDTSGWFYPRKKLHTTGLAVTNESARFMVQSKRVTLRANSANTSNVNVTAYVITDSE